MRGVVYVVGTIVPVLRARLDVSVPRRPRMRWEQPNVRTALGALVVAAAYYVGAQIGFSVRFQSSPISPIWPPNAILLVALLLAKPRAWRAILLAVFGAHLLVELPNGVPLTTTIGLYLTNAGEGVLGASLVRRFSGGAPWLRSLRRVVIYLLCAVVAAPAVTSFADALVVVFTRWGNDYWLTWSARCVSNIMAEVTIGPALLLVLTGGRSWLREATRWRRAEATLLAMGLLLVGVAVFGGWIPWRGAHPIVLYAMLPFLLWAAVRFDVGGTSATLLGITILATWSAVIGRGPFSTSSPSEGVIALQVYLIGVSATMLLLAALLHERKETQANLLESETRFRTMADHAPVLMWMSGPDAACTFVNATWLAFTGRTPIQERGTGWSEGVHPDDVARCLDTYQKAFAARQPHAMEYRLRRHDGVYHWVMDYGVPRYAPGGRFAGYIGSATDITERKQAEEALHASEERYRSLVESQTEMICRYLPDTTLTFVNEAFCRLYGRSRDELIGRPFLDLLGEPAREHHIHYTAALAGQAHPQISVDEHEIRRPDGSIGWVQWVDNAICDAEGRVVELQAIGRDITERKRAEVALRESEARFRAAFESAATGMMLVRTDGHPLRMNRPMVEMLGYSEEELRSRAFAEFTHPDDVDKNLSLFHRALAGEIDSYQLEKRFIHKDGHIVWGMLSAGVVRDAEGQPLYLAGHVQDITERKQAELALRESEERYRAVVNNFPHGAVLLFGQDLQHLVADGQGLPEMGLSKEAIEGKTIWEAFPADLSAALAPRCEAALSGDHAAFDHVHADRTYYIQVLPVRYGGTSAGMVVMQDVTEQRRAEALAALDRAKTAFLANVSHEFRTPLTLLLGPAADALSDRREPLPPRQRERIEIIQRSGLRLHKLVNTLLDFSSIEAGRLKAAFEPTDLAAFTAELASTFRSAIERAGVRLVVRCQSPSSVCEPTYVDRDMWEKIVLNLLSNALKFTFAGEIAVSLGPAEGNMSVELEVRDTGIGIPDTELPHLFERFYRVPGARGRTHEGTGIGLALVQELVRLHGGTIRVASTVGKGSSFTVVLPTGSAHLPADRVVRHARSSDEPTEASGVSSPVDATAFVAEALRWLPQTEESAWARREMAAQETPLELHGSRAAAEEVPTSVAAATAESGHPAAVAYRPGRVLVADDNADMRLYLTRLLGEHWDVDAVADGSAALAAVRAGPPDLIVADVMMPGLDGFALLRALRADPATRAIPVLLLSARAGEMAVVEGLTAGADDYLVKPFAARELLARVHSHLELARVRREAAAQAAQLDVVFDAITDGVIVLDAEGHVTHLNPAARRLFRLASGEELPQMIEDRARALDMRDPEGQPLASKQLPEVRLLRGEVLAGATTMTLRLRTRDRDERTVSLTGGPIRGMAGQVLGAVEVLRDVTKLQRAEVALAEQKRFFRTLVENSPDIITRFDRNLRHLYVSPAAEVVTGIPYHKRLGKTYAQLGLPEALFGPWEQTLREVFADGQARSFDTEFRAPGKPLRYSHVRYIPEVAADGGVGSVLGITSDITDLKQALLALGQSEERFSKAFHASPTAITITSLATRRILDVNEAAVQLTGYGREEMLGRTVPELGVLAPADVQRFRELRSEHTPIRDVPARVRTKSGEQRFCLVSTESIWLSGEECSITIVHDVTERERALEVLRAATEAAETAKREEEQRRREAERREQVAGSLRDVLTILNSNRHVAKILEYIARQAGRLLESDAVAIYTSGVNEAEAAPGRVGQLTLQATYGLLPPDLSTWSERHLAAVRAGLRTAMAERRPVAVLSATGASNGRHAGTAGQNEALAEAVVEATAGYVSVATKPLPAPFRALLAIPIVAQDDVYGAIVLLYCASHRFAADEVALAMAYGDHVALAIANSHLQDHIERAARDEERNRIARELHDTVTQEIFSASLLAQAVPRLWEHHRVEAERSLNELHRITRGALAALRSLLLELRPAVFEQRALEDLLRQLGDAMTARAGVPITVAVGEEHVPIPNAVKFAFYRIAQEALTNAAKHAAADHITVRLSGRRDGKRIQLMVQDNGQGFDTRAVQAGQFGIGLMRERARAAGATLHIRSRAGQGTRIAAVWSLGARREDTATAGERTERKAETHDRAAR